MDNGNSCVPVALVGVAYHLIFFSAINPGAYLFGAVNILQGILFLIFGVFRPRLIFARHTGIYSIMGWIFIVYALLVYPLIGEFLGHVFLKSPTFGLPCPTTIFTFGVLLWTTERIPKTLLVIPFLWSLIGFSAAFSLGIREDTGLLVAGGLGTLLTIVRDGKPTKRALGVEQASVHPGIPDGQRLSR